MFFETDAGRPSGLSLKIHQSLILAKKVYLDKFVHHLSRISQIIVFETYFNW